ncbi:MAG: M14 family zinc carboxypeptidase [Gaiellaceae bacterium]
MGLGTILSAALALVLPGPAGAGEHRRELLGYSVQDRPIRVHRLGNFASPRRILVVGCIHGNECAGLEITRRLVQGRRPRRTDLWVMHTANPDGRQLGVRQNARGVDLNRNFRSRWIPIGQRWDPYYSGPRPWSEPETRLARDLVRRIRPDVTIWYHQPQALVRAWGRSRKMARRYARLAREPYRSLRWPHGSAPNWQNRRFRRGSSFVVELAAGPLSDAAAGRHARAVRRLLVSG